MTNRSTLAGVILAGGYATRFEGGDKAIADLAGEPMIRRVAKRLSPVVDQLVVNCRADQRESIERALDGMALDFAIDPVPDRGPMAAIHTGLTAVDRDFAAVVACDMPFVDPSFLAFLHERARDADAAIPRMESGWFQTTQAVYRTDAMARACQEALDAEAGKILAAIDRLDAVFVEQEAFEDRFSLRTFENVNTRSELQAAAEMIRADR